VPDSATTSRLPGRPRAAEFVRREWFLGVGVASALAFLLAGHAGARHFFAVLMLILNRLIGLSLLLSVVTFGSGGTNVLRGVVHVLLFVSHVLLILQG